MTEFTVAVYRNPTQHRLRLSQVAKWAEPTVKDGLAGIMKRQKVRAWARKTDSFYPPALLRRLSLYMDGQGFGLRR